MIGKLLRTFIIVLLLYEIKCNLQPSVNNVYDVSSVDATLDRWPKMRLGRV